MQASLSLTARDREQVEEIRTLGEKHDVAALIDRLRTARWPARRAAVAELAALGPLATEQLSAALISSRADEGQIAAIVEALSQSTADVSAAIAPLLEHDAPAVVCDAATVLGRRRNDQSVAMLARLTAHADDNVAVAAVEALGRIGGELAVDALLALAATGSFFRVYPTIDVLGRCGDPRATEVLARLLDDSLYAADAARALGRTGDDRAIDALLKLLVRSSDANVRVAAVALTETHDRLYGRFGTTSGALMPRAPASPVPRLLQALSSADQHEEIAIVRLLGLLGDDEATSALIDLVVHGRGRSVAAAESALRELGAHALVPLLDAIAHGDSEARSILLPLVGARATDADAIIACVTDSSPRVRALAIDTLSRMGTTKAIPLLFQALRDTDARVSQSAVAAIQSLGSDQSEALAIAAANDKNPTVRRAGIRVLAYFGYAGALEPLLAAVSDPDERVREVALGGLPLLANPRADAAIYGALRDPSQRTRAAAVRALGHVEAARDVIGPLVAALADSDAWVRYFACQALAKRRDERAVPALIDRLSDEAGQVRVGAIEALSQFRDDRATAALTAAVEGDDPDVRRAAIIGFGLSGRTTAYPTIARSLRDTDPSTRLVAVSALATIGGEQVVDAIASATRDADAAVVAAAISVLGGRSEPAALERLIEMLDDPLLADRVLYAIAQSVPGRVPAVAAALTIAPPDRASLLAAALIRIRTPDAKAALIGALSSPAIRARRAIAAALAAIPLPEHRSAIQHALDAEHDGEVRKLLRKALSA